MARCDLDEVAAADAACENCGRTRRFARAQIVASGARTLEAFGARLSCRACRDRGRNEKNVNLVPYFNNPVLQFRRSA